MKKTILFILYTAIAFTAGAQQLLQERQYRADGLPKFMASSVPDGQGNILFSGMTLQSSFYKSSFLLVKPDTDTLWTRKGPDELHNSTQGLLATPGGDFLFHATKKHPTSLSTVGTLLHKFDRNGQPLWTQVNYDNIGTGNAPSATLNMADKGFLLGGVFVFNGQSKGFAVARTDSSGNILWKKKYTQSMLDDLIDMQYMANGNIIAVGTSDIPTGPRHLRLMLLDQNGDSLKGTQLIVNCITCYESMYSDLGSVTATADGGAIITAAIDTTINGIRVAYRGMLVKVGANLQLQWKYIHRTPVLPIETYIFSSVKELADHSILVLGFKQQPTGSNGFQL
ncbi:MAG TPA: hypothetical protein VD772_01265, partial [Anseongella sp.]|nr:hypothetical protein [Anseongella sp.]